MAEKKTFLLRVDPVLWKELEAWAAAEFRSVNGQIEYILHQAAAKRRGAGASHKAPKSEAAPSRE